MKTVYVGLSGGVDSSVAAALLKQQGYRVVGVHMLNWTRLVGGADCPWKEDLADAKAVAARLDIPLKIYDFQNEYKDEVVDYMVSEYSAGRTPNPDIKCNEEIKFKLFLNAALKDGADLVATGHYNQWKPGRLLRAADDAKDQTYFLYRISEEALRRTFFPLGDKTKPEVRRLAAELGLPTAAKPDSQGICFVGEVGIKDFLSQYIAPSPGPVVRRSDDTVIGQHDGAAFFTIGQRHGLGIGGGRPYFVVGKDMPSNTVYVTDDPDDLELTADTIDISQTHWIGHQPKPGCEYQVRDRHRGELIDCTLEKADGVWRIRLDRSERAVSPGQSAVIYDGDEVVGGGEVVSAANLSEIT